MDETVSRCRGDLRQRGFPHPSRPVVETYMTVIRRRPHATSPLRRRQANPFIGTGRAPRRAPREGPPPPRPLPADRVGERQAPGVQERALEPQPAGVVPTSAVRAIPQDRMPDRRQVHPDLVRPSGSRDRLQSVAPSNRSRTSNPVSACLPSVASTTILAARRPSGASTAKASLATAPRTSARYPRSTAWTPNMLLSAAYASSVLATTISPDVPTSSRCTMPGRSGPPAGASGTSHPEQAVHERPAAPAGGGMRHEAGGLHDHEEVVVLVADRHGRALGGDRLVPLDLERHPLPTAQAEGLRPRLAVDLHLPRGDRALDVRSRLAGHPRDDGIEPALLGDERSPHRGAAVGSGCSFPGLPPAVPWRSRVPTHASMIAPITIAESARLKTGQTWKSMKSTTRPRKPSIPERRDR